MTLFKNIILGTPDSFNVCIEIPKDSPVKYEYDEKADAILPNFVFTGGFVFKYNYGFIPQTLAEDGDTLDVMVLSGQAIPNGTVIKARAIGMIDLLDKGEVDNKILAVQDSQPGLYNSLKDLSAEQLQEFKNFYAEIAKQKKLFSSSIFYN